MVEKWLNNQSRSKVPLRQGAAQMDCLAALLYDCDTNTMECDTNCDQERARYRYDAIVQYDVVQNKSLSIQNAISCPEECIVFFSAFLASHGLTFQKRRAEADVNHCAKCLGLVLSLLSGRKN
jgi:hypothetical protein